VRHRAANKERERERVRGEREGEGRAGARVFPHRSGSGTEFIRRDLHFEGAIVKSGPRIARERDAPRPRFLPEKSPSRSTPPPPLFRVASSAKPSLKTFVFKPIPLNLARRVLDTWTERSPPFAGIAFHRRPRRDESHVTARVPARRFISQ